MRPVIVTSLAVAAAAALAVPLALSSSTSTPDHPGEKATGQSAGQPPRQPAVPRHTQEGTAVPGKTRTIRLAPLAPGTDFDRRLLSPQEGADVQGLTQRRVKPFSLVGVTWTDPAAELSATVQVRTRSMSDGTWTGWQDIRADTDDAPTKTEGSTGRERGGTAPLWVGPSNGVEVRVLPKAWTGSSTHPEPEDPEDRGPEDRGPEETEDDERPWATRRVAMLPEGLRLDMVDPGQAQKAPAAADARSGTPRSGTPRSETPEPKRGEHPKAPRSEEREAPASGDETSAPDTQGGTATPSRSGVGAFAPQGSGQRPGIREGAGVSARKDRPRFAAPRPRMVNRPGWGADESLRESEFLYTDTVRLAFVHHSASGNGYSCDEAPAVIRAIYRYHVLSNGWRDIGYNFLVDKCGTIYEGRAGGVTKPVMGAHTYGFNTNSMGVAVLGTFTNTPPPAAAQRGVAQLTAWKLGLFGAHPTGTVTVTSGGGKYPQGTSVRLRTISGHRDGYNTECPGEMLYDKLGSIRSRAAALQDGK